MIRPILSINKWLFMDTKVFVIEKVRLVKIEILLPVLIFTVPLIFSGPQLIVGSIVNCLLFVSALKLQKNRLYLISAIPSTAALLHNTLFGKFTMFLLFFLPIIWIGNYTLMLIYKKLNEKTIPVVAVLLSSLIKSGILYLSAIIYFRLHLVPAIFITSMGLIQLLTTLLGGFSAVYLLKAIKPK